MMIAKKLFLSRNFNKNIISFQLPALLCNFDFHLFSTMKKPNVQFYAPIISFVITQFKLNSISTHLYQYQSIMTIICGNQNVSILLNWHYEHLIAGFAEQRPKKAVILVENCRGPTTMVYGCYSTPTFKTQAFQHFYFSENTFVN